LGIFTQPEKSHKPHILKALNEMNRVLKSGGKLIFCEHGRAPDKNIRKWKDRINPIWEKISGGCNLNSPISNLIEKSGFKIANLDANYESPLKVIGSTYRSMAVPA